jgi:AcrR family transcriptional regulator
MSRREDPTPIWARPGPGERRPAYTRERIAQTALLIADEEGIEAVTMRRIARVLGAGTMTLYHYVRNKEELMALMDDAIMGELLIPDDELADGWREAIAQIARRSYEAFQRHPWTFDLVEQGPGGPNALRHVEQSLAVAARAGLDVAGQFELVSLVDDYVFGHAMRARRTREEPWERLDAVVAYVDALLGTGQFPQLAAWAAGDTRRAIEEVGEIANDPERFERGLQTLLDGIELRVRAEARG